MSHPHDEAAAGRRRTIVRWHGGVGYPHERFVEIRGYACTALAVAPDGRVISGWGDGQVRRKRPGEPEAKTPLTQHAGPVTALAVLPDGRVVSGSDDNTVRLTDPVDGTTRTLTQHESSVTALAVLPDGRVVSGSGDKTVRLTDPVDGTTRTLTEHVSLVTALEVLPDGRVVSGSHDGIVRLTDPDGRRPTEVLDLGSAVPALTVVGSVLVAACEGRRAFSWPDATQFDRFIPFNLPAPGRRAAILPADGTRPTLIAIGHELGLTFYRVEDRVIPADLLIPES